LVIGVGLLVAVVSGIAGGGFESVSVQTVLFAVSSLGWVVATAILAFRHGRRGEFVVGAGFLILTIAETLLWVNGRTGDPGYEIGFAGGAMFYVPGLLMMGLPAVYHWLVRVLAVVAAGVWAVGSVAFWTGSGFASTDPLALVGYALLSAAFVGVVVATLRGNEPQVSRPYLEDQMRSGTAVSR
jgi:hypothetical protein